MSWQPITLFYQHSLSNLVATSEASGFPVANILDRLDGTLWKATSTATQYITHDAGAGNTIDPNYLLIFTHNLKTAGATIVLQYSTDNFVSDIHDYFTAFAPGDDKAILKTFAKVGGKRYTHLKISGATVAPFIALAYWGQKTELDYADGLTPYNLERKRNVNLGDTGIIQGIHKKYIEWGLRIAFDDVDSTLFVKIQACADAVEDGLFGVSWDPGDHPTDVRVLHFKDGKFTAPLKVGGLYVDNVLDLVGRKE